MFSALLVDICWQLGCIMHEPSSPFDINYVLADKKAIYLRVVLLPWQVIGKKVESQISLWVYLKPSSLGAPELRVALSRNSLEFQKLSGLKALSATRPQSKGVFSLISSMIVSCEISC